jgi:hydroxyethylthiazole kinase-like uncharacterized protein yjeF
MRAFDARAIEQRVPGLLLMENAGRGAADVAVAELLGGDASGARVVVVCGTGNNGGDGFVVARRLAVLAARPVVFLAGRAENLRGDARANLDAWRGIGGELRELPAGAPLAPLTDALGSAHAAVDALFGTGLDRDIEGHLAGVVREVNRAPAPVLAVDLPSGLDADTGVSLGVTVAARCTATFAFAKLGLLTPNGARLAGRVVVVDIGVPPVRASLSGLPGALAEAMETADVARWVASRSPAAHKTSGGHVLVVGGSPGKIGAPQLAARGAMRAGAGLATIATWPDAAGIIEGHVLEVMTARIDRTSPDLGLKRVLHGKHAVVVGPGLGVDDESRALVERVLGTWEGPVVVDADALSMFAGQTNALAGLPAGILTPHPGELGRLAGKTPAQVEADRFGAARELAAATGAVVVLKGAHSVVASPDGRIAVSPVACSALATAGAGDVLGGVIAAMACALAPFEAACAGVLLHALGGEQWSRVRGAADRGMLASEIADAIPGLVSLTPPAAPTGRR